jgi:hypothetical protein
MSGRSSDVITLSLPDEMWSRIDPSTPRSASEQPPADADLVSRLRAWRDTTRQTLNVPAYVILTNAVIDEIARAQPRTLAELSGIKGIGAKKAEQHGEALLAIVANGKPPDPPMPVVKPHENLESETRADQCTPAATEQPAATSVDEPSASPVTPPAAQPAHYWTWRLLSQGFSPEECAAIRSLTSEVVLDHALRAADSGWPIDARWFLSAEEIATIRAVLGPTPPTRIRPLLEKLPRGTRYEVVQLVLKSQPNA